ncbi:uncharacterized protein [Nicotiana sylvestris]|uniref:uncharacterized protein n=1 Tax=Nicotiana sylvestris TaxID=4096 RepID=UPI00388C7484
MALLLVHDWGEEEAWGSTGGVVVVGRVAGLRRGGVWSLVMVVMGGGDGGGAGGGGGLGRWCLDADGVGGDVMVAEEMVAMALEGTVVFLTGSEDKEFDPALKAIIAIVDAERKPKAAPKQEKREKKTNTVKAELEKKAETKTEKMVPSKNEVLYIPRGRSEKPQRISIKRAIPMYMSKGAYVVRGTIKLPRLNELVVIGCVPQKPMTDPSTVPWNYQQTLVTYKGKEITGELPENTSVGKYSDIQEVNNATRKRFPSKKPVSAEEAEAFFQNMNMLDYKVVDQLRKYPEQVSMLSLLMKFAQHQKILLKTLNEAYVTVETSVEQLERMTERFFAVNQVSFRKNDLPPEGEAHNKALHLTVKCEDYYVKRVMLDGGSGVDICPLSTLQRMEIGTGRIRPNNVCVRAFDGIKRDTLGEIDLILTIGPVEFEVTFQVLDMDTSYNFLLGRSWIHAAWDVHSTLHQMVKFEDEGREIVIHGEDEQSIYRDPSIPCLEEREGSEHTVYQVFEVVLAEQYEEGSPCPQPFLSNASIMVAKEMIRQGFKPGKGLGKSLPGITEPITLPSTKKLFGIGFQPTPKDEDWAEKRKNEGWKLPRPLPHLYETFVRPKYIEEEDDEAFTVEEIEEICGAMREMLYETHTVQLGEGTSTAEVLMDEEDAEKTAFTTPWGTYYYQVMSFGLKNAEATYMRAMTAIFHDMMHQEIEVYVEDVIVKSRTQDDHVRDLRKFFERLRKYDLKLNPAKCAFGVPPGKLLGFIVGSFEVHIPETDTYGRLAKWQILLTEFDIVYVTCTTMKAQALADHLAKNPVDEEYQPLSTYFPDEEINTIEVHGDLIHTPPTELHPMSAPWPFVAWGKDVIGPIEPKDSNGHRFILVAIDYFTKWVKAITLKSVTKKAVVDFVHSNLIYRFVRTSVGATPYLLVYGTEAVIQAEVEIPSLRTIVEAEIEDSEWVKTRLE